MVNHPFYLTDQLAKEAIKKCVTPGMVLGIEYKKKSHFLCWGQSQLIPTPKKLETCTLFDVASLTKILSTASIAAKCIDQGLFDFDTQIFNPPYRTVGALLSHTAGYASHLDYWKTISTHFPTPLWKTPVIERSKLMKKLVLKTMPCKPTGMYCYSDISYLHLGYFLEEFLKMPLDEAAKQLVWDPLKLENITYAVADHPSDQQCNVASTEVCSWRNETLRGLVHDDNAYAMGGIAPHAGVFTTAQTILDFARHINNGFISSTLKKKIWASIGPPGCHSQGGWDTPRASNSSCGRYFSSQSRGHLGFSGTSLWIDPDIDLIVTLLTNRVHPSRENIQIQKLRPAIHDAIFEDLLLNH